MSWCYIFSKLVELVKWIDPEIWFMLVWVIIKAYSCINNNQSVFQNIISYSVFESRKYSHKATDVFTYSVDTNTVRSLVNHLSIMSSTDKSTKALLCFLSESANQKENLMEGCVLRIPVPKHRETVYSASINILLQNRAQKPVDHKLSQEFSRLHCWHMMSYFFLVINKLSHKTDSLNLYRVVRHVFWASPYLSFSKIQN